MFGKSLDFGAKRDLRGALEFFVAHLVVLVGVSTVLVHFLGMVGAAKDVGGFFDGGQMYTLIGSLFVMWLGGMILTKRGQTSDILSILVVAAGVYLAWTTGVMIGLVPIALLTTMGK
jgi:hypothetical protein